ncbi:hypothetical protein [Ornithinibacillus bavariensis]|uniref:hypothetical protein n=1 Tax=Ornithinibacillus bavariensis TaxID=545502 RepID=UPI000EC9C33D|nr:hypothetical protein [Ornithinibacillus sp.]
MLSPVIQEEKATYGSPDYDRLWKKLISELFEEFILFFAPFLHEKINFSKEVTFLQQDFFQEILDYRSNRSYAVLVIKVPLVNGNEKWLLIHIEINGKADRAFRKQMFRYFYRIYDKYDREIYAIAILTNSKGNRRQNYFDYHYYGTSIIYHYHVYNYLEQDIHELQKSSNPFSAAVLAGIYANETKNNDLKRYILKRKLMVQVLRHFSQQKDKSKQYLSSLFYFIDYLLPTREELQSILTEELSNLVGMGGADKINFDISEFFPTSTGNLDKFKKH